MCVLVSQLLETLADFNEVFSLFVGGVYVFYSVTGRISKKVSEHFHLELQLGPRSRDTVCVLLLPLISTFSVRAAAYTFVKSLDHLFYYFFHSTTLCYLTGVAAAFPVSLFIVVMVY